MEASPPHRVLVVLPSWVGDAVMATPALRLVRTRLPGSLIGGMCRPGIDRLLEGTGLVDEWHVDRASGIMGPKIAAGRLRPRRYEVALLLSNSLRTALVSRMAMIPRRVGYERDGRGLLLTDRLRAPKDGAGGWAIVPAVSYYWHAAARMLGAFGIATPGAVEGSDGVWHVPQLREHEPIPTGCVMELVVTSGDAAAGAEVLARAGVDRATEPRPVLLNPGGNDPAKRWPAERFAQVGAELAKRLGCRVLVAGSPAEAELAQEVARGVDRASTGRPAAIALPHHGLDLRSLKAIVGWSRLMVTNDTGPRHVAAALGTPVVSLFGPTDHRWTTVPAPGGEAVVVADPDLPTTQSANDHAERCAVERITVERVLAAAVGVMAASGLGSAGGSGVGGAVR